MASIFLRLHVAYPRPLCDRFLRFIVRWFLRKIIINNEALHFMPRMNTVFRVRCRHHSMADLSLDGDTVDGATVVGRGPAFIQLVCPRVLY